MQEDSAVLARAHLKLTGCDRHQPECRISGAMVTDCNAGHVWCLWHRTNLLIQVALSWTRLITTVMLSQLPVPLVHPASIDVCTMQKGVVEVEMFHSKTLVKELDDHSHAIPSSTVSCTSYISGFVYNAERSGGDRVTYSKPLVKELDNDSHAVPSSTVCCTSYISGCVWNAERSSGD